MTKENQAQPTENPEPAYRQFLKELGVTTAQFEYRPDFTDCPVIGHVNKMGLVEYIGSPDEVDLKDAPDEVPMRPSKISFRPVPEVKRLWYNLDLLRNEISIVEDGNEGIHTANPERELTLKAKALSVEAEKFEIFRAMHKEIAEAGARYGYKMQS